MKTVQCEMAEEMGKSLGPLVVLMNACFIDVWEQKWSSMHKKIFLTFGTRFVFKVIHKRQKIIRLLRDSTSNTTQYSSWVTNRYEVRYFASSEFWMAIFSFGLKIFKVAFQNVVVYCWDITLTFLCYKIVSEFTRKTLFAFLNSTPQRGAWVLLLFWENVYLKEAFKTVPAFLNICQFFQMQYFVLKKIVIRGWGWGWISFSTLFKVSLGYLRFKLNIENPGVVLK